MTLKIKRNFLAVEISSDAVGTYRPSDIAVRDTQQYALLVAADADPLEVVLKVKAGRGNKGFGKMYGASIIEDMARQVNSKVVVGYEGHTPEEDHGYVKRDIATYWLGAIYEPSEEAMYVRGLIANGFDKLKLEVRSGIIGQISLYGPCAVDPMYDDQWNWIYDNVTSLDLESLDWTPPGMAGMETELISMEMEREKGEKKQMDVKKLLNRALKMGLAKEIADMGEDVTADKLIEVISQAMESMKDKVITDEQKAKITAYDTIATAVATAESKDSVTADETVAAVMSWHSEGDMTEETADEVTAEMKKILDEKVGVPEVRELVKEMVGSVEGKSKVTIASEIDKVLAKESVKSLLKAGFVNNSGGVHTGSQKKDDGIPRTTRSY